VLYHWFLTCTFSSCLPDPHHLAVPIRPGFVRAASRPPRRLPDQAALSFNQAAATTQRRSRFTSTRSHDASWRTVSTFHTHETRPGRVSSLPRGRRCSYDRRCVRGRRLPPSSGRPLPPRCSHPTRDVRLTRHQQGFSVIHPSGLPLTCDTRSERAPLGFPLGFAPSRYQPRTPGRGQVWNTDPGHVFGIRRTSNRRTYSYRATSCRTALICRSAGRLVRLARWTVSLTVSGPRRDERGRAG
jgi:hypothetical protein